MRRGGFLSETTVVVHNIGQGHNDNELGFKSYFPLGETYPTVSSEKAVGERISGVVVDDADHVALHGDDLAAGVGAVADVDEVLLKVPPKMKLD